MADIERKRRNAQKMREVVSLLETRVYATLSVETHFDVELRLSVKDGAIQDHVEVNVRYKDRLP
jgi:hypothetical protein